jgi:hypothetical protein
MITCCPICSHIFDKEACEKCGWRGPYYPTRTVDDLDEKRDENVGREKWHHKIDAEGH